METVLTDEKEIVEMFVKKVHKVNQTLIACHNRKMVEYGLNSDHYVGGLECAISSKEMSLEQNINNLLAVYSNNYVESISFQCENIEHMNILNLVIAYFKMKGLSEDFLKFRDANKAPNNSGTIDILLPQIASETSNSHINNENHVSM